MFDDPGLQKDWHGHIRLALRWIEAILVGAAFGTTSIGIKEV